MRIVRSTDLDYVPASHEDPNKPGVLKRVLATKEQMLDGRPQMINWARLPVGSSFKLHYHEDMEESFIIISGHAEMRVDNELHTLQRGDMLVVSPGEQHDMANVGETDVEYVVIGVSLGKGGKTVVVDA
ncbi:MAG: cupin domain-containing protein [Planctomycetales bacterium]|nr:cupin domain-containing protein [Planctomycetales bacterium]